MKSFISLPFKSVIQSVLLVALVGCASSSGTQQSPVVIGTSAQAFKPPVPEQWTLPNGLTVMFLNDTELPVVSGTLYVRGGGLWEPKGKVGLAGALGDLMRSGGAGSLSADALDEQLEKLSASVSSSVGGEFGAVSFSCLTGDFEKVFGIASDVLLRPRFEQSRIDLWKGQSLEAIRRRPDDPWTVAGIAFAQLVYGPTAYGKVLVEKNVNAVSAADLKAYHQDLIRPDGAILVVVGSIDRKKVETLVQEKLGGWVARGRSIGVYPPLEFEPKPGVYYVPLPLSQASVYIGQQGVPRLTPDYPAIEGFNQVFGSGFFGSRLIKKVRAELGLVYGIFGGVFAGPVKGRNFIAFQTKGESAGEAIKASLGELVKLQEETAPKEELQEVQRAVSNSFIFHFESTDKAIGRRANQELLGFPPDFDDTFLGKIQSLTPEDIRAVAKNRWELSKLVIVVVGNEKAYSSLQELLKDPPSFLKGAEVHRMKFDQRLQM